MCVKPTFKSLAAFSIAGLLFVGCTTTHSGSSCCDGAGAKCDLKMPGYEYKTVKLPPGSDAQLNEASQGGWKLVSVSSLANVNGYNEYIFERLKK